MVSGQDLGQNLSNCLTTWLKNNNREKTLLIILLIINPVLVFED